MAAPAVALEAELVDKFEVVPLASGNIAGVGREDRPGRLAEEPGIAAEKQTHELVIVTHHENEAGTAVEKPVDEMVTASPLEKEVHSTVQKKAVVWMTQVG